MIEVDKIITANKVCFFKKGTRILHRVDGPAQEWANGDREWYINGKLHREDGPAVEWESGIKKWLLNGRLHRVSGPAFIGPGVQEWRVDGKFHREDGPALIRDEMIFWYLQGNPYTKEEWLEALPDDKCLKAIYSEYFIGG
jgi:hypothetical protein